MVSLSVQVNLSQKYSFFHQLTNNYDNKLFIELQVQYEKTTSLEQVVYIKLYFVFVLIFRDPEQFDVHNKY